MLSFVSAPHFEAPADAGADNVYDVTVSVSDGKAAAVLQALAITVTDVFENSAPVIASPAAASASENQLVAATLSATDANGDALTYAIAGGSDAARFTIDVSTGVLSFVAAPNYEAPADADTNNVYDVTVSVSDGTAAPVTQALAITVTDVFENSAPVITSPAAASAAENQLVAATLSATDANGDALTYAIAGGSDAARFTIDASTGVLSFVSAPDFEAPADAGANNVYDVTVSVSDGTAAPVTQTLAITVADVFENSAPVVTSPGHRLGRREPVRRRGARRHRRQRRRTHLRHRRRVRRCALHHRRLDRGAELRVGARTSRPRPTQAPTTSTTSRSASATARPRPSPRHWRSPSPTSSNKQPPTIAPIAAPNTNEDVTTPVQINLLSGATDPEGNTIAVLSPVTVTSSNTARTVVFNVSAAGVLSFDSGQFGSLNAGQSELLTVSYRISDGVNPGVLNTATITVEGRDEVRWPDHHRHLRQQHPDGIGRQRHDQWSRGQRHDPRQRRQRHDQRRRKHRQYQRRRRRRRDPDQRQRRDLRHDGERPRHRHGEDHRHRRRCPDRHVADDRHRNI